MRIKRLIVELDENEQFQYAHAYGRMLVTEVEFRGLVADTVRLHGWTVAPGDVTYQDEKLRRVAELPPEVEKAVRRVIDRASAGGGLWTA